MVSKEDQDCSLTIADETERKNASVKVSLRKLLVSCWMWTVVFAVELSEHPVDLAKCLATWSFVGIHVLVSAW